MPLIPQQHILQTAGQQVSDATSDLTDKLDKLPPVKIVSMSVFPVDVHAAGSKAQIFSIVAVVEEVVAAAKGHSCSPPTNKDLEQNTSYLIGDQAAREHILRTTKWLCEECGRWWKRNKKGTSWTPQFD